MDSPTINNENNTKRYVRKTAVAARLSTMSSGAVIMPLFDYYRDEEEEGEEEEEEEEILMPVCKRAPLVPVPHEPSSTAITQRFDREVLTNGHRLTPQASPYISRGGCGNNFPARVQYWDGRGEEGVK